MKYTTLGNSEEQIPVIGMGIGKGSGNGAKTAEYDARDERMIRLGVDLGMTLIDVAYDYGCGRGEEALGRAVKNIRNKVFIATKFPPEKSSYREVIASAEASLRRLQTDRIDLYQTHWPSPEIPLEETLAAMGKLMQEGKVRHIGLSNVSLSDAKRARAFLGTSPFVTLQHEYNLVDRTAETQMIPFCRKEGVTFVGYSPLAHRKLPGSEERVEKLNGIAARHGLTSTQLALSWLTREPGMVVLARTGSEDHLKENERAADFVLPLESVEAVENLFPGKVERIPASKMRVRGDPMQRTYASLEEALENRFRLAPSPIELAGQIRAGEILKPVKVVGGPEEGTEFRYEVVEGKLRYWAWVIAYGKDVPIPSIVQNRENAL